jgi:hypothetical protein
MLGTVLHTERSVAMKQNFICAIFHIPFSPQRAEAQNNLRIYNLKHKPLQKPFVEKKKKKLWLRLFSSLKILSSK